MNLDLKPVCDAIRSDGRYCVELSVGGDQRNYWCAEHAPAGVAPGEQEDAKARLRAAIQREADKVRQELPMGFRGRGNLAAVAAAADRLARWVFDLTHGEACAGDLDGDDDECSQCAGDEEGPCTCTCGMDAAWHDALIIRPQGVGDPQPGKEELAEVAPGEGR